MSQVRVDDGDHYPLVPLGTRAAAVKLQLLRPPLVAPMTAFADPSSLLRRGLRVVLESFQRAAPARFVRVPVTEIPPSIAFVCIYRKANAPIVQATLARLPDGAAVRLWALDEVAPDLSPLTIGAGPGGRTQLLNRLIDAIPLRPDVLVISDDDVEWIVGDVDRFVRAGIALGLDAFQPAHTRDSQTAFQFVRKRPMLFARETTFVEQGPVVAMSARGQRELLPLPEELVMGWGVEVRWHRIAQEGRVKLGIIDAVALRHDGDTPRRYRYDVESEMARLERELAAIGCTRISQIQHNVRTLGAVAALRGAHAEPAHLGPGSAA